MKIIVVFALVTCALHSTAHAQEEAAVGTAYEEPGEPASTETPPAEAEEEKKSPYSKKVRGLLWFELLVGPTSFDPDKFGGISITGDGTFDAPKVKGPEWGLTVGVGLGGFFLGAFYRQAHYDPYKLLKIGLDMQGVFRFIPYVHPMIRIDLFYTQTFDGSPYDQVLANADVRGGGVTLGAGLRIPIVRWVSFAATFDWSVMGFAVGGDPIDGGERVRSGIAGQQLGATFAFTFHFIGVRRD